MALLSIDMIREIQGVADLYAERERARATRAATTTQQRDQPASGGRQRQARPRNGADT